MMQFIIKITMLTTFMCAPFVHSNEKPIRMLDHCPNGKGCPEQEYLHGEPYDKNFEITESDYFPVEPRWQQKFESDIVEEFDHSLLGSIHVRVSGLGCKSDNYAVVEVRKDDLLETESMKKLVTSSEIISLIDRYKITFVYFIRVTKNGKYHDCEWILIDETSQWEMTCGN